jgi:two-component system sensor histidine kinase CpxA
MHRLFWKIFLSFWAALIVFAGATIYAASHYLEQTRQQQEAASPRERLARHAAEAQHIADVGGVEALRKWLREIDRTEPVPLLLVDRDGAELLGRSVPPLASERMAREGMRPRHMHPMARPRAVIRLPDLSEYLLIPDFQGVTLGRVLARPRVIALPLVVAALVSGLVCLVLARYLTAPLARLRRATESYASGDLSARVAPSLGARQDEVAELAQAFDRMAEQLQALMGAQRQLLSDVSHELRSPLARLQVALGLARQRAEGRASNELDRIERETERLNELIGQVLSLARLESGVTAPAREPVDLAELLERVAADADFEARAANRRVEIAHSTPATVEGDARLLRSALENIARNAVRYTAEGTAVTLSLARDTQQARWLVTIRDQGPGVPDDMLPRLFEPFARVGDARDRASGGYGLGLAIARKAIRLHGGEVSARNESEGGLSVVVALAEKHADERGGPPGATS